MAPEGKFTRSDFIYDQERDLYICPSGKQLKTSGTVHNGTTIKYVAKRSDCASCPLNPSAPTVETGESSEMSIRMSVTIHRP